MDNIQLDERLDRIEKLLLNNKTVLTFDEACDYTGISRSYFYKMTSSGTVLHSKPNGKKIFFEKKKLDEWLLQNHKKPTSVIDKEAISYTLKNKSYGK
ncbi:helix-turn-helix domain-containing protein [Tenacibaculum finnmarkense]|uniref:helix-turn-helix domain-containing protein n=1 Tax=Tenacibaculum finnmarkense TaxID=2781243 RepID=UPI000C61C850|nr:helix-turn-helix domain-containing protein [Tenacibaculum finnmarkense]MCD8438715.1 helix-turn-helix domain-containing protein [Tenacibaculum finnmarkense genomovar ulcerans]MCG8720943.1 helix-turn-helix domain-containing protein [Tenacibaculum finnmarkense]SOS55636.1 DNA binding domain-containing protein, excisionase family [Tenacibaculum finnmarkense]